MTMTFDEAFGYIERLITEYESAKPLIIAIDGRAAAGKTSIAEKLSRSTGVQVLHTDDFCRPRDMSGNLQMSEFCGNFDVERFRAEAVEAMLSGTDFEIGVFDCRKGCILKREKYVSSRCFIVEGAYSLYPQLGDYASVKLFFDIDAVTQKTRIIARNGATSFEIFKSVWIPAEERYIAHYDIPKRCDIIIK